MTITNILSRQTWYESLDYEYNPFSIKPNHSFELRGQDLISEKVIEIIDQKAMCIVHGTYGSGKTSLLHTIINRFKGEKKVVYFSCNRLTDELDMKRLLTERTVLSKLFNIKGKQMILLLDEADSLTKKDFDNILKHYQKGYIRSVVFISHNLKKFDLPKKVKDVIDKQIFSFERLDDETVLQIVRDRIGNHELMPDDVVLEIHKKSRSTRHFLKNCEIFMKEMVEKTRKKSTVKDVRKILE